MIESVPSIAACRVRATGASAKRKSFAASVAATARASATLVVERSMTMVPGAACAAISSHTAATCFPPGSERQITRAAFATSATEPAATAPRSAIARTAASDMSNTCTGAPCFFTAFAHIPEPITPRPMKPMGGTVSDIHNSQDPLLRGEWQLAALTGVSRRFGRSPSP